MITPGRGEPVIEPKMFVEMEKFRSPCERFILVFWDRPVDIAKQVLEDSREVKLAIPYRKSVRGKYNDVDICVASIFFGAPASVMALELLIAAGARKFLVFGGCGAIHPSVKIFDIVIPTWGIREEGTSYHYYPPDVVPKPSEKIVEVLQRELRCTARSLGTRLYTGGIWTTDAIFRETRDKIGKYSEMNVLAVDMESTALMSVAMYRGVDLGIALVVTDELYGDKWRIYQDDDKAQKVEEEIVKTMIKVLAEI
ncbi:nucleoside phosphorylase [Desulfurococcaceae archaeon MEX13E-LK6-19]|nr:nucleoside phosphorylase [Desulfurococcaceae archaeon MEX13E-LK6-19]